MMKHPKYTQFSCEEKTGHIYKGDKKLKVQVDERGYPRITLSVNLDGTKATVQKYANRFNWECLHQKLLQSVDIVKYADKNSKNLRPENIILVGGKTKKEIKEEEEKYRPYICPFREKTKC